MAKDIYRLLTEHLRIPLPLHLVGHDIGMMVAYAFASEYPKAVKKVVRMEAPLPGTLVYDLWQLGRDGNVRGGHTSVRRSAFTTERN